MHDIYVCNYIRDSVGFFDHPHLLSWQREIKREKECHNRYLHQIKAPHRKRQSVKHNRQKMETWRRCSAYLKDRRKGMTSDERSPGDKNKIRKDEKSDTV